jgi:hypothetical protein
MSDNDKTSDNVDSLLQKTRYHTLVKNLAYESNPVGWPFLGHPLNQAHLWTPHPLYPWQIDVIRAFAKPHSRVAVSTCNESGKTSTIAPICLLSAMCAFPGAKVFATSGSERQVREQLFEETLVKLVEPYQDKGWKITKGDRMRIVAPNGSVLLCYVCKKAENVEGFHSKWAIDPNGKPRYEPCIYLLDESKSVADDIHDAVRRIDPDFMIAMSSPGEMDGWFYKAIDPDTLPARPEKEKPIVLLDCEPDPHWSTPGEYWTYRRMISMHDCPHLLVPKKVKERENIMKKRGRNSPFVKSMIFGEFQASNEGNNIFGEDMLELLKEAMHGMVRPVPGDVRAAGDVSGGKDRQILMVRSGTEVLMVHDRQSNTEIEMAEYWVGILKELQIEPWQFWIDGGGIGAPVANYMELRLGYAGINRFMANQDPGSDNEYKDRYTEIHWWIRELLYHKVLKLPFNTRLIDQARKRRYIEMEDHRIKTEPKKNHREREKDSPDELDTLVYLFADFPMENFRRGILDRKEKPVDVDEEREWKPQKDIRLRIPKSDDAFAGLRELPDFYKMRT